MSEATSSEIKTISPRKPEGLAATAKSVFLEMFGQLLTGKFWLEVGKVAIHAFFVAVGQSFVQMLGGKVGYYESRSPSTAVAERAFGGAFAPSPSYSPAPSFPVPASPSGDGRFPGFAR